jgi:diaminohydroxyphosphoribosylaminopyrimidine deaminase/5-amino-6-(5-phosphoribosylamino)uracil reductase
MNAIDSQWMAQALRLAERGLYTTSPNPRVGCVLVKENKVIGEGWHERAGEPHAEVHALRAAGKSARGATAYITLEPCSHQGRTPPCADALIAAGVSRVVAAMQDPNPLVAGQGLQRLREAGITVECGLMEVAARELNIGFVSRMTRGTPWVRSKIAASLDGRIALANGASKWITGTAARLDVQHWRARSCAVLTGIGTVLADDPQLNVREIDTTVPQWSAARTPPSPPYQGGAGSVPPLIREGQEGFVVRQPLRVVLDSELRISPDAKILQGGQTLIYTASSDTAKQQTIEACGADVVTLASADGKVDLSAVLIDLAKRGINEVLVETGRKLNGALLKAGLVDELVLYLSPQFLGDAAQGLADLGELTQLQQRVALKWQDVRQVGGDLRIVAKISKEK